MSKIYGAEHRALQDEFDTRRLADLVEGGFVVDEVDDNTKAEDDRTGAMMLPLVESWRPSWNI